MRGGAFLGKHIGELPQPPAPVGVGVGGSPTSFASGGGGVEEVDLEEKGNEKEEADLGESVRELWATGE